MAANGETRWALTDHQGSVRDVVDDQGMILNHITYDSFGQITRETNPDIDFRFGYTGRELDEETGLMYYRARYFDPAVGTFVSEDPLGFDAGDANVYRYVFNNPTNFTDPSGNFAQTLTLSYGAKLLAGTALATTPLGWAALGVGLVGVVGLGAYYLHQSRDNASPARLTPWDFDNDFSQGQNSHDIDQSVVTSPQQKPELLTNPLGPALPPFNEVFPNYPGLFDPRNSGGFCEDLADILKGTINPPPFGAGSDKSFSPYLGIDGSALGIPENWIPKPTKKSGGTIFVNLENTHDRVRVMPGNPNSPNVAQQGPYAKRQQDGKFFDKDGNEVSGDSAEAHIPLGDFNFF